jgi:hypothetical protein
MAHTSKLRVDYHPFSTVTWCLLQKGYHCVCLSVSDTGRIQIVGSMYLYDTYIIVVTLCSTKVYILLFCLACRTLHVDINRGVTEFDTHLSLYLSCIVVSICIHHTCIEEEDEEDTLFTKYGPTRGMNIHI